MSARLKRQAHVLCALHKGHPSVSRAILKGADKDLIQCISECCYNVLQGNVRLTPSQRAQLSKYKQKLRQVAGKKTALKAKAKVIQSGGFLPALLAPIAKSVLVPAISKGAISLFKQGLRKIKKIPNRKRVLFRSYRPRRRS